MGPIEPDGIYQDIEAIGWRNEREQFIRFNWATNQIEMGPLGGEVQQANEAPTRSAQLSADQRWLIYIESEGLLANDWRVVEYELASGRERELYRAPTDRRINDIAISPDPDDPRLLALVDDATERGLLPVQLLLIDSDDPAAEPTLIVEQGRGRAITGYLLCDDDEVIYVENFSRLWSWRPGTRARLLRAAGDRLAPWSCR